MKKLVYRGEAMEDSDYRMPVLNTIAVALMLFAILVIGVILYGGSDNIAQQPGQTMQKAQAQETALNSREAELFDREKAVENRERAMADSEAAVKDLAGIRTVIIDELADKLSGLKLPVEVNEVTGSIRFTEAVLFDVNKDTLKAEGQKYLKTFVPAYLSVLLGSRYEKYLEQVIIEGHADNGGTYWSNLYLSQKRADSVVNFILEQNLAKLPNGISAYNYFTVSARSLNVPVLVDGVPDRNQSPRVEYVFRLKDDEILKQLQQLYKGEQ